MANRKISAYDLVSDMWLEIEIAADPERKMIKLSLEYENGAKEDCWLSLEQADYACSDMLRTLNAFRRHGRN